MVGRNFELPEFPPRLPSFLRERAVGSDNEYRLAQALWRLIVEYGGNRQIDRIAPHFKEASIAATQVLEDTGWYEAGKGFLPH